MRGKTENKKLLQKNILHTVTTGEIDDVNVCVDEIITPSIDKFTHTGWHKVCTAIMDRATHSYNVFQIVYRHIFIDNATNMFAITNLKLLLKFSIIWKCDAACEVIYKLVDRRKVFNCSPVRQGLVCAILHTLGVYMDDRFLHSEVSEYLLESMGQNLGPHAKFANLMLENILRSPKYGFVCFSPMLLRYMGEILMANAFRNVSFIKAIIEEYGTGLLLICARYDDATYAESILQCIAKRLRMKNMLIELWPDYMSTVLGTKLSKKRARSHSITICPITCCTCEDAVVASDGQVYERSAILKYLVQNTKSPVTRNHLSLQVVKEENFLSN